MTCLVDACVENAYVYAQDSSLTLDLTTPVNIQYKNELRTTLPAGSRLKFHRSPTGKPVFAIRVPGGQLARTIKDLQRQLPTVRTARSSYACS